MALVEIGHHPELTPEIAAEIFRRQFGEKYEVYKTGFMRRDFIVKKSPWTAVGVKLQQARDGTSFVFTPLTPNVILQTLFGGLIQYVVLRSSWKALEEEMRLFIEGAAEFH